MDLTISPQLVLRLACVLPSSRWLNQVTIKSICFIDCAASTHALNGVSTSSLRRASSGVLRGAVRASSTMASGCGSIVQTWIFSMMPSV
eukprot:5547210-Prymnesium_polylepis.1